MQFRRRSRHDCSLDITPMVDVVFMLLIFFMVTTSFTQSSGIKLDLPAAKTQDSDQKNHKVIVTIDQNGLYYIGQEQVAFSRLSERILHAASGHGNAMIVIQADKQARHEAVVHVLDTARMLKFYRLAIATEPIEQGSGD